MSSQLVKRVTLDPSKYVFVDYYKNNDILLYRWKIITKTNRLWFNLNQSKKHGAIDEFSHCFTPSVSLVSSATQSFIINQYTYWRKKVFSFTSLNTQPLKLMKVVKYQFLLVPYGKQPHLFLSQVRLIRSNCLLIED